MARMQPAAKFGPPLFHSVRRLAHQLDESPAATYDRIKRGEIRACRVGGKIRVREADWQTFLHDHVVDVPPTDLGVEQTHE